MDLILEVEPNKIEEIKKLILKDETVNRASITFKEGKNFGIEKFLIIIEGNADQIKKAKEIAIANNIRISEEKKTKEIIEKIKEEKEKAIKGFGFLIE